MKKNYNIWFNRFNRRFNFRSCKSHPEKYEIVGLTINNNYKKLIEQVKKFKPKIVSINDTESYKKFKEVNQNQTLKVVNARML